MTRAPSAIRVPPLLIAAGLALALVALAAEITRSETFGLAVIAAVTFGQSLGIL